MAYPASFVNLAQSVHLAVKNRYYDDIESDDGQVYLDQVADWVNQWLDELETTTDRAGNLVQWKFARVPNYELGSVATDDIVMSVPNSVETLVSVPQRNALLVDDDGALLSKWRVVDLDQIKSSGAQEDRVAFLDGDIYFSRPISESENNGTLTADVTISLPRVSESQNRFSVLNMVKPRQLMVLGVAKNSSLPDLVRGGLSPSFLQRYQDLLQAAIQKNGYTSVSDEMGRDDMSYIRGIF